MKLLKIPNKFNRSGIKIKCLKCKWQLSDKCRLNRDNPIRLSACEYINQHRFNLVVCIPNTKSSRKTKIIDSLTFDSALIELGKFKEQLRSSGYQSPNLRTVKYVKPILIGLAAEYLDTLSGVNTYEHLIRIRSKQHIGECKKVIERFCKVLTGNGYNINAVDLEAIGDREIALFHNHLLNDLKLSKSSYNKHFVIMKAFINWAIKIKMLNINNHFSKAQLTFDKSEKTIINQDEFDKLLTVITYENGWGFHSGEKRNYFKPWLVYAYRLAIQTGVRAEELVRLKWNNLIEIEQGVWVLKIDNLKVNRIQTGNETGKNIRYIPLTKGLLTLLTEMGYNEKIGVDEYILSREETLSIKYIMTFISRSFGHYIKMATTRKIEFKDLRKTYITRISMTLGENTKIFTGHADNEVLKNHYISSAYVASNLNDFDVFKTNK